MATAKDFVTQAFRTIEVEHNNIHEGVFFEYPIIGSLPAAGTFVFSLKTPAEEYVHYRNEKLACSGDKLSIALQEGATLTGGTTVSAINHNRVSSKVSSMIVKVDATLTTAGTTISIGYIGGGTGVGGTRGGGETSQSNEYVLKRDTVYAVIVTNNSAATNTIVLSPQWYEEGASG
jgi:hypothetical protein